MIDDPNPDHENEALLDRAVAAVMAEAIPPGPPPEVLARLRRRETTSSAPRSGRRRRFPIVRLAVAAVAMLALLVGLKMLTSEPSLALEDVAAEFRKARSIQLRILFYSHKFSDEKRSHVWREVAFGEEWSTSSGLSREVTYDEEGIPWKIETKDRAKGVTLVLWPNQKKAQLTEDVASGEWVRRRWDQRRGSALSMLESWLQSGRIREQLGTREIHGRTVVGLRVDYCDRAGDFWVDRRSRQIVRFLEPTAAEYDPDEDPVARNPPSPDGKYYGQEIKGWVWTDIVYDPPLDGVPFVCVPPEGYTVERIRYREPTEQDVLEWLEVFAHVRGGSFNDDESPPFTEMAETDQREKLHRKPPDQRTSWEEKFMRGFIREEEPKLRGHSAVVYFGDKYQETWHYQGKGVKLGDANTAICWYRPPGAEKYRVVYGDLKVRDVAEQDLPPKR